jgi:hypothetical protein
MKKLGFFCVFLLAISTAAIAQQGTVKLTMDEVSFQPVNGLTIKGVTFADTAGAYIDATNGGQMHYVQDPALVGQTGGETLTMTFNQPAYGLQFGVALSTQGSVTAGFTVQLYDPLGNALGGPIAVNTAQLSGDNFTEGLFTTSLGDIGKAVVTFNSGAAVLFGLDNVVYGLPYFYFTTYYSGNVAAAPDEIVRIINDGYSATPSLWASIYVFDDSEELTQCCSCKITPDGVLSESVKLNLTANPIRGIVNSRGVIKVISSQTEADVNTGFAPNTPYPGLRVYSTHIQGTKVTLSPGAPVVPSVSGPFFVSETEAANSNLSTGLVGEQSLLENLCYFDFLLSGKPCTCQPEDYDF